MPDKNYIPLHFQDKIYIISPDFNLVHEIESELGSIAALHGSFLHKSWKISDLVTLVHMMLQASGETVDYICLGDLMLKEGLSRYFAAACSFLQMVLSGTQE